MALRCREQLATVVTLVTYLACGGKSVADDPSNTGDSVHNDTGTEANSGGTMAGSTEPIGAGVSSGQAGRISGSGGTAAHEEPRATSCSVESWAPSKGDFHLPPGWEQEAAVCPPAPRIAWRFASCEAAGFVPDAQCKYAAPSIAYGEIDGINSCVAACNQGELVFGCTLAYLPLDAMPACPTGARHGSICAEPDNGECAIPGPNADRARGIVDGQICACDKPGPRWRCISLCRIEDW